MKSVVLAIIVVAAVIPTIISAMSVLTVAPFRVAIIGGGVSGCASARRLAQLAPTAQITLYEIGRGPGGRASTRKTRSLPGVCINHGAPYCDIRTDLGKSLITSLDTGTAPFTGVRGCLEDSTGKFSPYKEEEEEDATMYITGANGEMSQLSSSLLSDLPSINTKYKTMIRGLAKTADGVWEMRDKSDTLIGSADWLIVAGSGVAHPRWTKSFGGVPPLIEAESNSPDPQLRQALDDIAKQQTSPVMTVFFSFTGQVAREWLSLDFNVAEVKGSSSILSKIIVHGNNGGDGNDEIDDWCSVVLHSTEDFANQNSGTYGASSSAARIAGAASDSSLEDALIEKMMNALAKIPGIPTIDKVKMDDNSYYGPMLHRWGNAFPKGEALAQDLAFLPSSRISFCGDYVASPEQTRLGSCEAALLSGTFAGESIANYYAESVIDSAADVL